MSDSLWPHGLLPTRLLCPWNFPGKNTERGCRFLFQGIFSTQGSNPHLLHLLHWQADSSPLNHLGNPTHIEPKPNKQTFLLSLGRFRLSHSHWGTNPSSVLTLRKPLSFSFLLTQGKCSPPPSPRPMKLKSLAFCSWQTHSFCQPPFLPAQVCLFVCFVTFLQGRPIEQEPPTSGI